MIAGIVGIAIGVYTLVTPQVTAVALTLLIGTFAFVRGIAEVGTAIWLRNVIESAWLYVLSGIVSIAVRVVPHRRPRRRSLRDPLRDRLLRSVRRRHLPRDRACLRGLNSRAERLDHERWRRLLTGPVRISHPEISRNEQETT